jgi:hypothetical protein
MTIKHGPHWMRPLARTIRPFGLVIVPTSDHAKIVDAEGNVVAHVSSTPGDRHVATINALRDLKKRGLLTKE